MVMTDLSQPRLLLLVVERLSNTNSLIISLFVPHGIFNNEFCRIRHICFSIAPRNLSGADTFRPLMTRF